METNNIRMVTVRMLPSNRPEGLALNSIASRKIGTTLDRVGALSSRPVMGARVNRFVDSRRAASRSHDKGSSKAAVVRPFKVTNVPVKTTNEIGMPVVNREFWANKKLVLELGEKEYDSRLKSLSNRRQELLNSGRMLFATYATTSHLNGYQLFALTITCGDDYPVGKLLRRLVKLDAGLLAVGSLGNGLVNVDSEKGGDESSGNYHYHLLICSKLSLRKLESIVGSMVKQFWSLDYLKIGKKNSRYVEHSDCELADATDFAAFNYLRGNLNEAALDLNYWSSSLSLPLVVVSSPLKMLVTSNKRTNYYVESPKRPEMQALDQALESLTEIHHDVQTARGLVTQKKSSAQWALRLLLACKIKISTELVFIRPGKQSSWDHQVLNCWIRQLQNHKDSKLRQLVNEVVIPKKPRLRVTNSATLVVVPPKNRDIKFVRTRGGD